MNSLNETLKEHIMRDKTESIPVNYLPPNTFQIVPHEVRWVKDIHH